MTHSRSVVHSLREIFSDQCSGLPPGSTYLTVISFPVDVGTAITVTCPPALLHSGSSVITCVKGTNFETTDQPQCTQVGKFKGGDHGTGTVISTSIVSRRYRPDLSRNNDYKLNKGLCLLELGTVVE